MPVKFHTNPTPYWPDAKYIVLTANYELCHILTPDFAKSGVIIYGELLCKDGYHTLLSVLDENTVFYDTLPNGFKLCSVCKDHLQDMIRLAFEPGSPEAREYGCNCTQKNVPWQLDFHKYSCPLYKHSHPSKFRSAASRNWKL